MADTDTGSAEWWAANLSARLPRFRHGQSDARLSHQVMIRSVVAALREASADEIERELRLIAAITTLDYELKTLLLRLIEDSADREIWQKYLALVMWQVLEELARATRAETAR